MPTLPHALQSAAIIDDAHLASDEPPKRVLNISQCRGPRPSIQGVFTYDKYEGTTSAAPLPFLQ